MQRFNAIHCATLLLTFGLTLPLYAERIRTEYAPLGVLRRRLALLRHCLAPKETASCISASSNA